MPPVWLDENAQRVPTRACPRPGCGREYPLRRYRYETLRQIGWPLFRVARFVNWCGHAQELIPVPDDAEWVRRARRLAEQPTQRMLLPQIEPQLKFLVRMDCVIMERCFSPLPTSRAIRRSQLHRSPGKYRSRHASNISRAHRTF